MNSEWPRKVKLFPNLIETFTKLQNTTNFFHKHISNDFTRRREHSDFKIKQNLILITCLKFRKSQIKIVHRNIEIIEKYFFINFCLSGFRLYSVPSLQFQFYSGTHF